MGVTRFPSRASGPAERLSDFAAHLRANGLFVGPAETAACLTALSEVNAADPAEARLALRAVCAGTRDDVARFDDLFDAFWRNAGRARSGPERGDGPETGRKRNSRPALPDHLRDASGSGAPETPEGGEGAADQSGEGRLTGSRIDNLARTDLREFVTPEAIAAAEDVAFRLARAIRDRRSRRRRANRRGETIDLRRVARASVATGGVPLRLFRRTRPDRPARLVAICDVSGSMTVYSRVFLAFLKGLMGADAHTDAYLFHTRLVRITDALRDGDTMRSVAKLSLMAEGFGGGTKIGRAIEAFNRTYARRLVSGRSVVVIVSDGYDTDPPEVLATALARLKQRGCRIVWLNPLKGWKGYEPVARGMAAALPHLDLFAAANTLDSLAALEPEFARL
ncbi:vWA domain-containing protein [Ostreiculturibacter nitratireducens]|uniref:vWA domain-containing protein n=1 Tax=Ostreiculturibacter nitratireducens TaxID=3075226 RepID=UPI0031B60747